ncbi:MAG: hypothetical protein ABR991_10620 [Terracidiphilus sp.]|jgi:hypothetical protein
MDIREMLVDSYNPALITDCSDYSHDVPPTSLRAFSGSGTLGHAIGPSDTTFTVNFTAGGASLYKIMTIDTGDNAENVEISAINGSTVTVVRNFGGLNTSHAAGAPVTATDYVHLNAQGYQIVANEVAKYLSAYSK